MKRTFRLGVTLGLYAAVSCLSLAVVNNFTAPVIKDREIAKEKEGLRVVFRDAKDFVPVDAKDIANAVSIAKLDLGSVSIDGIYLVTAFDDSILGFAAKISGPTYDTTSLLLGMNPSCEITGVHILSTTDSKGYGSKAADPNYKTSKGKTFGGQFAGVKPLESFEKDKDYEAISGATMTTNGVTNMILLGSKVIKSYYDLHQANLIIKE